MHQSSYFIEHSRHLLIAFLLLFVTSSTEASCLYNPKFIQRNVSINMGRITIRNDLPVGAVIAYRSFNIPGPYFPGPGTLFAFCKGGTMRGEMLKGNEVPGYDHVYTTDVAGVGIQIVEWNLTRDITALPFFQDFGVFNGRVTGVLTVRDTSNYVVKLFKIAPTTGDGPLGSGTYARILTDDGVAVLPAILSGDAITIVNPTCSVDAGSQNILVDFGRVPEDEFRGRGSTTANRAFNIRLNCNAGRNAQNTIYMRMDAQEDPSNEAGVLKIASGERAAAGVGIQVLDQNSRPVTWGDNMRVGLSKDGSYDLSFTARYFQTGALVTGGRADGNATFTFQYK